MYAFHFYVPESSVDIVLQAVFSAGAGKIGNYDQCCFRQSGKGQFRPLLESNPTVGERGKVAMVAEVKIEMVCSAAALPAAINALMAAHPYEQPAIHYWPINPSLNPNTE